jgi:glycerol-3-phosphate acyltransferase PlsX
MTIRLSVDGMSGDHGPSVTVDAAAISLDKYSNLEIQLVGQEEVMLPFYLATKYRGSSRLELRNASEVVSMDEKPSVALRNKRDSSMRVALDLVKNGECDACVSAGNTGALMAIARFVLHMLPGLDRPAICSEMPSNKIPTYVLDLGANVDCDADKLFQFAIMGSVLAATLGGRERPKIGLLNVGEEEIKGSENVKKAASMLASSDLNYTGFAEGNDIFTGMFDVIVCDGFVGNIALKASEGAARMLTTLAKEEFQRSWLTKLGALCAMPSLTSLKRRADPGAYNGASMLGLQKTVVKSHGGADAVSFSHAIEVALQEADKDVPKMIAAVLEKSLVGKDIEEAS